MAGFDQPEDRLAHEAEELMRQRRFGDAAERYGDLLTQMPTDLWATLGRVSALECAGQLDEARSLLDQLQGSHRRSASFQRFRHLFLVRREDFQAAAASQRALRAEVVEEGPDDQLADLYFNQGRYHEACGELTRLVDEIGEDGSDLKASLLARLGACLRQLGDADSARERLQEALAIDHTSHWALSELAEAERALGDFEAARRRYREALEASPEDHWTRGHLAQMEFEDGNREAAVAHYEHIIAAEPNAAWAHVELAQALTETDVARSTALCLTALDLDPKNPWAHAQLGALARRGGRLPEAREHYQRAHQGAPSAVWVLHELADVCRHLGRRDEGYEHLIRARDEDPYHAITYGYFADFLRHDGRETEALANLAKALEIDPDYTWAWRERAELMAQAGRHDEAQEAYLKACELEPEVPINDGLKAYLLRCQQRRDLAVPYLERAVERHPTYLWAWRERLEQLLGDDHAADAERVGMAAVAAMPDCAPLWGMLAESRRRLAIRHGDAGKRAQAVADVAKALELDANIPQLWAIHAELAAETGHLPMAEQAARTAVALADAQQAGPEYRTLLAQVLVAAGKVPEAEALLTAQLQRLPLLALQPAWELAAVLAERRGELARARGLCEQALSVPALASDPRLRVRAARLSIALSDDPAATSAAQAGNLLSLFAAPAPVAPWREVAHIFAQGGRPLEARRAAYLALEAAGTDATAGLRTRVQLAELELALGNHSGAQLALNEVLAREPEHLQARILGAALADHRGDVPAAIEHLQHLTGRLQTLLAPEPEVSATSVTSVTSATSATSATSRADHELPPALLRQLATLCERSGDLHTAEGLWDRLAGTPSLSALQAADVAAERLAFRLRHREYALTSREIAAVEARLPRGGTLHQQVLREAALAATRASGGLGAAAGTPAAGLRFLLDRDELLDADNRLLLVRLALAAGQADTAKVQVARLLETVSGEAALTPRLLQARALLASGDPAAAEAVAQAVWRDQHHANEEAAAIIGECHACRGRFEEAMTVLADPALPSVPALERVLLQAVVALEIHGEAWALAALGRHGPPSAEARTMPLVKVFLAAWPAAWAGSTPASPLQALDLVSVPPFPRLAVRLAQALLHAGEAEMAVLHLRAVIDFHQRRASSPTQALVNPLARRLRQLLVEALCRSGQRGAAWKIAISSFSLRGCSRCLNWWN